MHRTNITVLLFRFQGDVALNTPVMLCFLLKKREFISCCGPWLNIIILNLWWTLNNIQLHTKKQQQRDPPLSLALSHKQPLLTSFYYTSFNLPLFFTFLFTRKKKAHVTLLFGYAIFTYTVQCVPSNLCKYYMHVFVIWTFLYRQCMSFLSALKAVFLHPTQWGQLDDSHTISARKVWKHSSPNT